MSRTIEDILALSPVMPVVVLNDHAQAVPLARALLAGGIRVIEITLRTADALRGVEEVARHVPDIAVGAGTVLTPKDLRDAEEAGAAFTVSPGATPELLDGAQHRRIPFLPGVATASELMLGLEFGFMAFKFFPAAASGGVAALKALAGPFPGVRFCPTGGIDARAAPDYLALPTVACIGGSWVAPEAALAAGDYSGIEALAREAAGLARS